jgi:hypothetical protein
VLQHEYEYAFKISGTTGTEHEIMYLWIVIYIKESLYISNKLTLNFNGSELIGELTLFVSIYL